MTAKIGHTQIRSLSSGKKNIEIYILVLLWSGVSVWDIYIHTEHEMF